MADHEATVGPAGQGRRARSRSAATLGAPLLGAADPASLQPNTKAWANWHLVGAFSGIGLVAWTYLVAWNNILANHAIITGLVAEVARLRKDRDSFSMTMCWAVAAT